MSSSVERLLKAFCGVKSLKLGDEVPKTLGKAKKMGDSPILKNDEKIAIVGSCWKASPIGWQVLFAEYVGDKHAKSKVLDEATKKAREILDLSGENVIFARAIAAVAVEWVISLPGFICCECSGTGVVKAANRHLKKCAGCIGGRVQWSTELRYAKFVSITAVSFKRFKKLDCQLDRLVEFLETEKSEAVQSCESKLDLLKIEHNFV